MPLLFKLQILLQLTPSPFTKPSLTTTLIPLTVRCLLVSLEIWRFCTKMHTSLLQIGKRTGQLLMAAYMSGLLPSCLFYVTDRSNSLYFLIDTGAEVSVIPPSATDRKHQWDNLTLHAVSDSPIACYSKRLLTVNIGLQQTFQWIIIVADVKQPIIGADFLWHYNLLVDMGHNHLTDALTTTRNNLSNTV